MGWVGLRQVWYNGLQLRQFVDGRVVVGTTLTHLIRGGRPTLPVVIVVSWRTFRGCKIIRPICKLFRVCRGSINSSYCLLTYKTVATVGGVCRGSVNSTNCLLTYRTVATVCRMCRWSVDSTNWFAQIFYARQRRDSAGTGLKLGLRVILYDVIVGLAAHYPLTTLHHSLLVACWPWILKQFTHHEWKTQVHYSWKLLHVFLYYYNPSPLLLQLYFYVMSNKLLCVFPTQRNIL